MVRSPGQELLKITFLLSLRLSRLLFLLVLPFMLAALLAQIRPLFILLCLFLLLFLFSLSFLSPVRVLSPILLSSRFCLGRLLVLRFLFWLAVRFPFLCVLACCAVLWLLCVAVLSLFSSSRIILFRKKLFVIIFYTKSEKNSYLITTFQNGNFNKNLKIEH